MLFVLHIGMLKYWYQKFYSIYDISFINKTHLNKIRATILDF